jgi:hypothetical protein
MAAADQRRASRERISAGQLREKMIATAAATAAHVSELGRSVPLFQPYTTLSAPEADAKIPADMYASRAGARPVGVLETCTGIAPLHLGRYQGPRQPCRAGAVRLSCYGPAIHVELIGPDTKLLAFGLNTAEPMPRSALIVFISAVILVGLLLTSRLLRWGRYQHAADTVMRGSVIPLGLVLFVGLAVAFLVWHP